MRKNRVTQKARISAAVIDIQTPLSLNISGSSNTVETWKTSVRIKEIIAETSPLLSAVNKDEAKMFIPAKR